MDQHKFKLYVVKDNPASNALVERIETIFNSALKDKYRLEVIDIIKNPELAIKDKVIASPTLIMELPQPEKRLIGQFNNEKILLSLNLIDKDEFK